MSTDDSTENGAPGEGERIAKVLSRAGVASRRDAERLILEGRVAVNGQVTTNPATNVTDKDRLAVDGEEVGAPEATRIWLYHKPTGLVTTEHDEEGRPTVFESLPDDMPRVMSVGRLDLTSEGLLLLTNDGEIKRRLELPSTGWTRRYRVRIHGTPTDAQLQPLREGVSVDGVDYQPMEVSIDRQQGSNAWLSLTLREGKNREIRRVMEHLGFTVNRLIRVSYGPFQLGDLPVGDVEEVRSKIVRDQLGLSKPKPEPVRTRRKPKSEEMPAVDDEPVDRPARDVLATARPEGASVKRELKPRAPRARREGAPDEAPRPRSPRKPSTLGAFTKPRTWMRAGEAEEVSEERPRGPRRDSAEGKPRSAGYKSHGRPPRGESGEERPRSAGFRSHRAEGATDRRPRPAREEGDRPTRSFRDRPVRADDDRPPRRRTDEDRPRRPREEGSERPARAYKPRPPRDADERPPRPYKPRPPRDGEERPARSGSEGRPQRGFKPSRPGSDREGDRPARGLKPSRPGAEGGSRTFRGKPSGERPVRGDRAEGGRPPRGAGGPRKGPARPTGKPRKG